MIRSNRRAAMAEIDRQMRLRSEAAAITVENKAKEKAPVDTGRLRASLTHDSDASGFIVGTNTHYAVYQELGTRYQRPQPFLKPALLESLGEIKRIYGA